MSISINIALFFFFFFFSLLPLSFLYIVRDLFNKIALEGINSNIVSYKGITYFVYLTKCTIP